MALPDIDEVAKQALGHDWDENNPTGRMVAEVLAYLAMLVACVAGPTLVALLVGYLVGAWWAVPVVLLAEVLVIGWCLVGVAQSWFSKNAKRDLDTEPLVMTWRLTLYSLLVVGILVSIPVFVIAIVVAIVAEIV